MLVMTVPSHRASDKACLPSNPRFNDNDRCHMKRSCHPCRRHRLRCEGQTGLWCRVIRDATAAAAAAAMHSLKTDSNLIIVSRLPATFQTTFHIQQALDRTKYHGHHHHQHRHDHDHDRGASGLSDVSCISNEVFLFRSKDRHARACVGHHCTHYMVDCVRCVLVNFWLPAFEEPNIARKFLLCLLPLSTLCRVCRVASRNNHPPQNTFRRPTPTRIMSSSSAIER